MTAMPYAHYVTTAFGQIRVWRSDSGRHVVVLPGVIRAASTVAADLAMRAPGLAFTVIELPALPCSTVQEAADAITAAVAALSLAGAPAIAFDLAKALTTGLSGAIALVDAEAAWPPPPDITPRADGTHLTTLFAHLRNAHVLDAAQSHAARHGPALPDAQALDAAILVAGADPQAFRALWITLLRGTANPRAERMPDIDTAIAYAAVTAANTPAQPHNATSAGDDIWYDYADTPRGRMHLRRAGRGGIPVIVLASAPGSSAPLSPVLRDLAADRQVVAPDYLGNGASDKPQGPVDIATLAADILALADALGLDRFDLWGTHTGALIALEASIAAPQRVRRLVLEAPPLLPPDFNSDILAHYFPPLQPHPWGLHLQQAWNMRRDMFLFWPWYRVDRAAARPLSLPDPAFLHDWTMGLLQSGATYDRSYRAAFEYDTRRALRKLSHPALVCAGPSDMLADGLADVLNLAPDHATFVMTSATVWYPHQSPEAVAETLSVYRNFLTA